MAALWVCAQIVFPNQTWNDLGFIKIHQILWVFLALLGIQVFGMWLKWILGSRVGALLTGFLAGFVSSTALTLSLAKKSQLPEGQGKASEKISALLAAQIAVILEAFLLMSALSAEFLQWLVPLFLPCAIVALALIGLIWQRGARHQLGPLEFKPIDYRGAVQMSLLISGLLFSSQFLIQMYGESSLLWAHFGLALFEVHGAFISAAQLHLSQQITAPLAILLLATALSASFVSKFFIVFLMGSRAFFKGLALALIILLLVLWGTYGFLLYAFF